MFIEGVDQYPVDVIAEQQGIAVVHLDRGNEYFERLTEAKNAHEGIKREWQIGREGIWVQRIEPPGLLIAGSKHIEGAYGLVERLREKGIGINVALSFEPECMQISEGIAKILEVDKKVWEQYCTSSS